MGRRDKSYSRDLHQQIYDKLTGMQHFGESKHKAMNAGSIQDKIFSKNTYLTYLKHCGYFADFIRAEHPECTTLRAAQKYIPEWLDSRVAKGLSPYTVQTEAKALGKLYGIAPGDPNYYEPPVRNRENITRSRLSVERDSHFSVSNNQELINFAENTGLRRSELARIKSDCLLSKAQIDERMEKLERISDERPLAPDEARELKALKDATAFSDKQFFIEVTGKGGRLRVSPIIGEEQAIVDRIRATPDGQHVWQHVHSDADIHAYRGTYATRIYREYAREIEKIPYDKVNKGTGKRYQSEVYTCRKDEAERKLDRAAMRLVSVALGHNRVEIMASHYLRGL